MGRRADAERSADDQARKRSELLALLEEAKRAGTWAALKRLQEEDEDARLIKTEISLAQREFVNKVAGDFELQKGGSTEVVAFVRRLVEYCAEHGPRVDIRFRSTLGRTLPDVDERLLNSPRYTGRGMLPKQYFKRPFAIPREQHLGRRLQARLQHAFPPELVRFELGERIDDPREVSELPEVEVPTLFVDYLTGLNPGGRSGRRRKGEFVDVTMVFITSFRIPGQTPALDHRIYLPRELTPELIDESQSAQTLYETVAAELHDAFARQFLEWLLEPPSNAASAAIANIEQPDQPFEPDPEYLDPTHDQSVRFSRVSARCGSADANCLPIPYNGNPKLVVGSILQSRYDPNAQRTPASRYRAESGAERCAHDGDCLTVGNGRCTRWDTEVDQIRGVRVGLSEAYCGCVQKQCQWFTQPRSAIHVEIKDLDLEGWPGRLPMDPQDVRYAMDGYVEDELKRCFVNHLKQLPRRIVLSVEQKRDRGQQTGTVQGATLETAGCIEHLFPAINVSLDGVTNAELEHSPIRLRTTLVISVRSVR